MAYAKEIHDIQIDHLKAQQKHLNLVRNYHVWMMSETDELMVRDLHHTVADRISAVLSGLDKLIEALELSYLCKSENPIKGAGVNQF